MGQALGTDSNGTQRQVNLPLPQVKRKAQTQGHKATTQSTSPHINTDSEAQSDY